MAGDCGELDFRTDRGEHAVRFINNLTHTKGEFAGKPFNLRPWQEKMIREFFGTIDAETGLRQYNELYLEIPRKNGKSELAAAIVIYLLLGDGEYGAEIYGAAADKGQAGLIYDVTAAMIENDSELLEIIQLRKSRKEMGHFGSNSFYKAISKDSDNKHGFNAHGVIIDELHTFQDNSLIEVLETSSGARRQPVRVYITTAGGERKGPCWNWHVYAKKVLEDPSLAPNLLPFIFAAEEDDDWRDPEVWKKANPALGDFRYPREMEEFAKKAEFIPAYVQVFKQLYLNIWPKFSSRALDMDVWDENAGNFTCGPAIPDFLKGRDCYGGLDLASVSDLNALILVFPPTDDDPLFYVHCYFWLPENTVEKRSDADKVFYREWVKDGFIVATPGDVTDYAFIRATISGPLDDKTGLRKGGLIEQVNLIDIGVDPFNATHLVNELTDDGVECVLFRQGYLSMNPAVKEVLRLMLQRKIAHGGNTVLQWMAENLVLSTDPAGNFKPDKANSSEKIDGMVGLFMAVGRWLADKEEKFVSRFEQAAKEKVMREEGNQNDN